MTQTTKTTAKVIKSQLIAIRNGLNSALTNDWKNNPTDQDIKISNEIEAIDITITNCVNMSKMA